MSDRLNELLADATKESASDFHETVVDWMEEATAEIARQRMAISTMASWLGQTPGVWGTQDVRGIEDILTGVRAGEKSA